MEYKLYSVLHKWRDLKKIAIYDLNRSITYEELYISSMKLADKLPKGIDKIGLLFENSIEFIISFFAINAIGSVACIINYKLKSYEISKILQEMNINVIISNNNYLKKYNRTTVVLDFKQMIQDSRNVYNPNGFSNNKMAVMLSTSGTTNKSKMIFLSDESIINGVKNVLEYSTRNFNSVDFINLYLGTRTALEGQLIISLYVGGSVVLGREVFFRNDFINIVNRFLVTHCYMVPSQLKFLLECNIEKEFIDSLFQIDVIGEKMDCRCVDKFFSKYPEITLGYGYGTTELGILSYSMYHSSCEYDGNVGKLIKGVSLKLKNSKMISGNIAGELYFKNSIGVGINDFLINENKYYNSGDIGYLDEEGRLYICGRKTNIINCCGNKIFPEEVEEVISMYHKIKEVRVYGEIIKEVEVLCADIVVNNYIDLEDLKWFLKSKLADYKIPSNFNICKKIDKTNTLKIIRKRKENG